MSTSFYERCEERRNLKNPDHLSLIDTHQSEVSSGYSTPYSHTALCAACLNTNRLIPRRLKRHTVGLFSSYNLKAATLDATPIACLGVRQSEPALGIKK